MNILQAGRAVSGVGEIEAGNAGSILKDKPIISGVTWQAAISIAGCARIDARLANIHRLYKEAWNTGRTDGPITTGLAVDNQTGKALSICILCWLLLVVFM
jgi:hypothetical protein